MVLILCTWYLTYIWRFHIWVNLSFHIYLELNSSWGIGFDFHLKPFCQWLILFSPSSLSCTPIPDVAFRRNKLQMEMGEGMREKEGNQQRGMETTKVLRLLFYSIKLKMDEIIWNSGHSEIHCWYKLRKGAKHEGWFNVCMGYLMPCLGTKSAQERCFRILIQEDTQLHFVQFIGSAYSMLCGLCHFIL